MKGMLSEKQRMLLVAVALIGAILAIASSAKLATRVVCGQWPRGEGGVIPLVGNLITLDYRGFVGTTDSGCQLGGGLLVGVPIAVLILAIVAVAVIWIRVEAYRLS